jgi:hypothetical protein
VTVTGPDGRVFTRNTKEVTELQPDGSHRTTTAKRETHSQLPMPAQSRSRPALTGRSAGGRPQQHAGGAHDGRPQRCRCCGKIGHTEAVCWHKAAAQPVSKLNQHGPKPQHNSKQTTPATTPPTSPPRGGGGGAADGQLRCAGCAKQFGRDRFSTNQLSRADARLCKGCVDRKQALLAHGPCDAAVKQQHAATRRGSHRAGGGSGGGGAPRDAGTPPVGTVMLGRWKAGAKFKRCTVASDLPVHVNNEPHVLVQFDGYHDHIPVPMAQLRPMAPAAAAVPAGG